MRNIAKMALLTENRNRDNRYSGTYNVDIGTYNGGEHRKQEQRMGKTSGGQEFDHQTAKEWTGMMKNADGTKGAKWTMEQVKPYMAQTGFKGEEMEFFAIMNAMYSDYCDVMKRFGLDRPEVYAALAKAWLEDKDAVEDKALMYWECIVEHD